MADVKTEFRKIVADALNAFIKEKDPNSSEVAADSLSVLEFFQHRILF